MEQLSSDIKPEGSKMASGRHWTNICQECGRQVEILNDDLEFSMDLHKQSHKSLEAVNKEISMNWLGTNEKNYNSLNTNVNYCHDCKENIEIINNDLTLSFQLHAQKHKHDHTDALSDNSSTCSGKSKGSGSNKKEVKDKTETRPVLTSILDAIFHTMPVGLKSHRGFISENGCSKAVCNLCNVTIDPIFSVSEHLKTKLHEDNTIQQVMKMLPIELHNQMEFVSFYGSNLCCNLCRCKIDLCSNNLHETVVSVFAHNAGKGHLSKKTYSNDSNQCEKTHVIFKTLALINPLINENQDIIQHKMQPFFKCKLCNKQIAYNEDENELLKNFTSHLSSSGHNRSLIAMSILNRFNEISVPGKEKHNFVVSSEKLYCTSCSCYLETNIEKLFVHVGSNYALYENVRSDTVLGMQVSNQPNVKSNVAASFFKPKEEVTESTVKKPMFERTSDQPIHENNLTSIPGTFKRLLQGLPKQFQNIITCNKKGEAVCSICNCTIPATTYNLTTHLNGSSHKTKENERSQLEKNKKFQLPKQCGLSQTKEAATDLGRIFDLLEKSNRKFAGNRKVFAIYDGKHGICLLCGTIIQASSDINTFQKNVISHIENQGHVNKVQLQIEMLQLLPRHRSVLVKELFDKMPLYFQKDMTFIKAPEDVNYVFCTICYLKIPRHIQPLQEHLDGVYHETSIERFSKISQDKNFKISVGKECGPKPDDIDAQFQDILKTNKEIRKHSKYLEKKGDDYVCKLCKSIMKMSYEKTLFENNIMSHITGQKHKKNVEKEFDDLLNQLQFSSLIIKTNRNFVKKKDDKVCCTLCSCIISSSDDIESLKYNIEMHLSGTGHVKKQSALEKATSSVHPGFENTHANEMIKELFERLPVNFQGDINYITRSTMEGYLSCILCRSVIDPNYLKEHLEKEEHVQKKILAEGPISECVVKDEVLQSVGTLSSLLNNIDMKSHWQKE